MTILKSRAFTIAEALITLMIISLILAAVIPVMSKRQLTSDAMWRYVSSGVGANSNIYYGQGSSQTAIIGASTLPLSSSGSRLVLVTPLDSGNDTIHRSILDFQQNNASGVLSIGKISFDSKFNIAIGKSTLRVNTTGLGNTAIGTSSLGLNEEGSYNTAMGLNALNANTTGNFNVGIGASALLGNTTGGENTATGTNALYSNTTGAANTALGTSAMYSNTKGSSNTALGVNALYSNSGSVFADEASKNTAVGVNSLYTNGLGEDNTAVGYAALKSNTDGDNNVAVGIESLLSNTKGIDNVAVGTEALRNNSTGVSNTALGVSAGAGITSGSKNVAIGRAALMDLAGSENVAIGWGALNRSRGTGNTAIGSGAGGNTSTNGSNNVFIGSNSGATGDVSNQLCIDISQRSDPLIAGNFSSRDVRVNGAFRAANMMVAESDLTVLGEAEFRGNATFLGSMYAQTIYAETYERSDKRVKNIYGNSGVGIEKLNQLQVKKYILKDDTTKRLRVGVIAQDLQKVFPNSVVKGPENYLYVDTTEIFYAMLNAVRNTYKQVQSLIAKVSGLDTKITKLEKENLALKIKLEKDNKEIKYQISQVKKRLDKLEYKK